LNQKLRAALEAVPRYDLQGRIVGCRGLMLTCRGLAGLLAMGDLCLIDR
jgi:hypothetical protein